MTKLLRGRKPTSKWATHRVELIEVRGRIVEIDVLMVPVIKWLNSLPSCVTSYCCEGDNNLKNPRNYISFSCNEEDLKEILRKLQTPYIKPAGVMFVFGKVMVEVRGKSLEYRMEFSCKTALKIFAEEVLK